MEPRRESRAVPRAGMSLRLNESLKRRREVKVVGNMTIMAVTIDPVLSTVIRSEQARCRKTGDIVSWSPNTVPDDSYPVPERLQRRVWRHEPV